ncbi:cytochrome c biogenesis protein ResB [Anaerobacillus sp. MEB173]|uniref:cytochrome c biogenesis protein ResB n=1 Tax=Anaerobacillus sp. MEB173 TaxID=3383345 RepID=UPI003F928D97
MDNVKCECGHINHHGTVICESCGKPLLEGDNQELLNMRYEGTARRSQTYNRTIIDKIWNFFSSVKVGIWIIVILLVASAFGTIFPQQLYIPSNVPPAVFYKDEYGVLGQIYYQLGFHNLYGSWWYMLLLASLGVSLIICSVDRVVPLYRALKTQKVTRHEAFLSRQRVFGTSKVDNHDEEMKKVKEILAKKKYKISEEDGNIVAEKGRFSRWGPYINHCGLILFLIGCMFRFFPGMYVDEHLWIRDGETAQIPGTQGEYFLRNDQFSLIMYDEDDERFQDAFERTGMMGAIQAYQTEATLFKRVEGGTVGLETELEEIDHHFINVNQPFKFDGYALYQVDYKLNEFNEMTFTLMDKETEEEFGKMNIDLFDPQSSYDLGNGYEVEIMNYFPDFIFNNAGEPATKSKIPDNPAFIFKVSGPGIEEPEISVVGINLQVEPFGENEHALYITDLTTKNVTALTVRRDFTLPFLFVGGFIFMFGLVQGSYWHHRRIWVQRKNDEIWIAGHANKNWNSLKTDIASFVTETNLIMPLDQVEEKEKENEKDKNDSANRKG